MSERLVYSVLKRINNEDTSVNSRDYCMSDNDFDSFVSLLYSNNLIDSPTLINSKITTKGIDFLKENHRYSDEIPESIDEYPQWVRYTGMIYRPKKNKFIDFSNSEVNYKKWRSILGETLNLIKTKSPVNNCLEIQDTTNNFEVEKIENKLEMKLPQSFKNVINNFSRKLYFYWSVPEEKELNINGRSINSGGYLDSPFWDLDQLLLLNQMRIDNEYLDTEGSGEYWKNSFIFCRHGNGNYFAIDLKYNPGEVIYLASDGLMHGLRLGSSFESFMDNWIKIGCTGHWGEDFELFLGSEIFLDHNSSNSLICKKWLGLI